jgi:hypothetical protein
MQGLCHLNKERREKGEHTPPAVEAFHLGFASDCNMSVYKFYIPSSGKCIVSNQAIRRGVIPLQESGHD